jgi:broad specificity phosphatase PhoE
MKFVAVYSSPMQRALSTAAIAGFTHPEVTPLLQEFDYGEYEGITTREIQAMAPGWDLYRDGCPGGETPAQVYARASQFLELATRHDGNVLAFAHGHILRAVAVAWMHLDITAASRLRLDVATLSLLAGDDHGRQLAMWNSP